MTGDVYMISNSATHFGIWKKTFVNNHYNIFGNLKIIIIHCWKVKIVSPSLQFINDLKDLSSVGNNIVHFLKENWLGYLKMSLLLTVGGQKAEKLKKQNFPTFYGTPCIIKYNIYTNINIFNFLVPILRHQGLLRTYCSFVHIERK